jgi:hypothetical protein
LRSSARISASVCSATAWGGDAGTRRRDAGARGGGRSTLLKPRSAARAASCRPPPARAALGVEAIVHEAAHGRAPGGERTRWPRRTRPRGSAAWKYRGAFAASRNARSYGLVSKTASVGSVVWPRSRRLYRSPVSRTAVARSKRLRFSGATVRVQLFPTFTSNTTTTAARRSCARRGGGGGAGARGRHHSAGVAEA